MSDTAIAHGSADGQGASEEQLRAALDVLGNYAPFIDDPVNLLDEAIDELLALRAAVAAQRPVVAAVERYGRSQCALLDEGGLVSREARREYIQAEKALDDMCVALARAAHGSAPDDTKKG